LAIARAELAGVLLAERKQDDAVQLLNLAMPVLRANLFATEINRVHAEDLARRMKVKV